MTEFEIATNRQAQLLDVTAQVNHVVKQSRVERGLCNIFVPHTTAAVIVSENWDPDVTHDLLAHLEKLVPRQAGYRHGEGNAQAHILSVMLGTSLNLPIEGGQLRLGRWQGVMFAEFDGPRRRSVVVSVQQG
ncbi:MAG TPA: secondary thiamine-phosphate synthase enzyme YjbQ [Candidatus Binataceae bacterium]|jgi:secondary thiamine-phosphate synthase enzyme|nr:secondary thiamine-phosphate synthase enzyme YjbQ [Candidatus Binataceae bacterium]